MLHSPDDYQPIREQVEVHESLVVRVRSRPFSRRANSSTNAPSARSRRSRVLLPIVEQEVSGTDQETSALLSSDDARLPESKPGSGAARKEKESHMKQIERVKRIIGGTSLVAVVVLASGCATSRGKEQALVCPQCREVTITRTIPVFEGEGNLPPREEEVTEIKHSCPGCQGALTTLFTEGKLQHKCSVCEQSPFSCPFSHR